VERRGTAPHLLKIEARVRGLDESGWPCAMRQREFRRV